VDKTENNFIDGAHNKYLFKEKIVINNQTVNIKKVDTFSDNPQSIEIKFTTIQKLYNDIHLQRENQTTLDDLHQKNIVMIADEAHHLNAETKKAQQELNLNTEINKRTSEAEVERKGWEHTVIELILNKNTKNKAGNKNVLLEFTATIPATVSIAQKYADKIIYRFDLKDFLLKGYTKQINLLPSTNEKREQILLALLFNWFRHKIAIKNAIPNFKSVVLFRSKTIAESKVDNQEFLNLTERISNDDFEFMKNISHKITDSKDPHEQGKSRVEQIVNFINQNNITYSEIAEWIKQNFTNLTTVITNSETTDPEADKLLNSLEDKNNHIRAIFTVDRLTEGWDVLNLFDIVRLYKGSNTGGSTKTTPEATIKEKQLIGRGVRYFPFEFKDTQKNKRRFDEDLTHELRFLEELFYFTFDEQSRYISHLKNELRKDGYIQDDKVVVKFDLKPEFKILLEKQKLWYNLQIPNENRRKKNLSDLKTEYEFKNTGFELKEEEVNFRTDVDTEKISIKEESTFTVTKKFSEIDRHIFLKAMNIKAKQDNSLYQFINLKQELEINSIDELQTKILKDFTLKITTTKDVEITNQQYLNFTIKFLENVFNDLQKEITPNKGGEFESGELLVKFTGGKSKLIVNTKINNEIITGYEWYMLDKFYGTDQENALVQFIKQHEGNIKDKYSNFYLLRNEEVLKIYDFEKGRGFMPDFLMFFENNANTFYQIFIEPKQEKYMTSEEETWKEKFLSQITEKYGKQDTLKIEDKYFKLIGLPFFNEDKNEEFKKEFDCII